jgi:serine/threonine-protein phosphatase 2A regulatory subunit B''
MDLLKPQKNTQFTLEDFLKKKTDCGLFINFLTDLNKLVAFDQRDAYE